MEVWLLGSTGRIQNTSHEAPLNFSGKCIAFILFGCTAAAMNAQQAHVLTDAEVSAAIQRADQKQHGLYIGLELQDQMKAPHGYSVHIYTSAQWIEMAARTAKRELKPFTIADVTPEMRQPVLHVEGWPDTPEYINGGGSNVHKVVLADLTKQVLIQPLSNEPQDVNVGNAFRTVSYTRVTDTFSMADVAKVRGASGDEEFYVVVVGDAYNKFFKVKSKMFDRIF